LVKMEFRTTNKTQVVIVGAGPTGLSLAAQLLRYNIDFILLEKNETSTLFSKAIVVQARTLEIFQELGIADEAIRRGAITTEMKMFYKGRQKLTVNLSGLGAGLSDFPFALSLEQSETEKLMAEYILKTNGSIHWKCEFTHFEETKEGVIVYYIDDKGNKHELTANYLVGCDGAGSLVRHQLDLSFEGTTEPKLFYVADVSLKSNVINKNALYFYLVRKGFILFFPMEGQGHYRIVGVLPEYENKTDYQFSNIAPIIKQQIITPVDFNELRWFSTYKVHSRKANSFLKGHCFIAGDAAHIHTPAGGQGMNTGIQDAYNLAWKIAYRCNGQLNDEILETYSTERTANAKRLLQTTDRMFDIMSGVNPFWNFLRRSFLPQFFNLVGKSTWVKRKIFPLISQIGIAYPDSDLTLKSSIGNVNAGDRMHYFAFSNGKSIFSYLTEPFFKLLYFGNADVTKPELNSEIKIVFYSFSEIPIQIFGQATGFYILLRPDNHVSYIGKDISKCIELINKISPDRNN